MVGVSEDLPFCMKIQGRDKGCIKRKKTKPHSIGLLLSLIIGEYMLANPSLYYVEQLCKMRHTSGGLPAPLTIFSSNIARTFSFGSPMPTAM